MADGNITVTLQDLRGDEAKEQALWAERGRWLAEKLSERATPDGRTVLELVEEPIWARADGTFADYCAAIDAAMAADEDWWASERPPTTEQPAVLGPVQRGVRALLTERETIARQAMRLEALEIENERLRRNIKNAINNIVCIGGPLNDNKLGYSKQQMVTFWRIKEELEA